MSEILVGADPELFVKDAAGNMSAAIGKIGGSKQSPRACKLGALQEDNVLAEYNIDPAHSVQEWLTNNHTVRNELDVVLKPHALSTVVESSHEFTQAQLVGWGEQALQFGCDPDYNAYTMKRNASPDPYQVLRTAGGHIHVGYNKPNEETNSKIIRAMDLHLGLPSILMDGDARRRELYGNAGAFRHKVYGVEYRSLSNFWLSSSTLMEWVYNNTITAATTFNNAVSDADARLIVQAINTNNKTLAQQLITKYKVVTL
jgi:hypothetical protein